MYFEVAPAEGFEWVLVTDPEEADALKELNGTPRQATWVPIRVQRDKPHGRLRGHPADFPWFDYGLAMRTSAVAVLRDLLASNGEILPLKTDDDVELFVFNARFRNLSSWRSLKAGLRQRRMGNDEIVAHAPA